MFPSLLRKQLSEILAEGFVARRSVHRNCIEMFPKRVWEEEMKEINRLNRYIQENDDFVRALRAGHREIEMDSTGRTLIPKDLASFAGLKKDIVCATSIDRIELWDKQNYEDVIAEISAGISALAEKVMGKLKKENEQESLS